MPQAGIRSAYRKFRVGGLEMVRKKEKRKLTMPYGINVRNIHRALGIFLSAVMVFNMLPAGGISVYASEEKAGFCEHHTEHTADCGYQEAQPRADCTHEHTEDCYKIVENCIHEHMESCIQRKYQERRKHHLLMQRKNSPRNVAIYVVKKTAVS